MRFGGGARPRREHEQKRGEREREEFRTKVHESSRARRSSP
jgi:hypothetical protein